MLLIAVGLALVWTLAMILSVTLGGYIHVLLMVAVGLFFFRIIRGRGPGPNHGPTG